MRVQRGIDYAGVAVPVEVKREDQRVSLVRD